MAGRGWRINMSSYLVYRGGRASGAPISEGDVRIGSVIWLEWMLLWYRVGKSNWRLLVVGSMSRVRRSKCSFLYQSCHKFVCYCHELTECADDSLSLLATACAPKVIQRDSMTYSATMWRHLSPRSCRIRPRTRSTPEFTPSNDYDLQTFAS